MNTEIQPQTEARERLIDLAPKPRLALVVLGENLKYGWDAKRVAEALWHSSISNKIQAIAARLEAQRYMDAGWVVDMINSTGDTAGIGYAESDALEDMEKSGNRLHLNGAYIKEKESLETPGNAEYTAAILRNRQYDKMVLITAKDHVKRSSKLFHAFGIDFTEHNASEDIYLNDPTVTNSTLERRADLIRRYRHSVWGRLERIKEGVFAFELKFDPKGKFIHTIVGGYRSLRNKGGIFAPIKRLFGREINMQPAHA